MEQAFGIFGTEIFDEGLAEFACAWCAFAGKENRQQIIEAILSRRTSQSRLNLQREFRIFLGIALGE